MSINVGALAADSEGPSEAAHVTEFFLCLSDESPPGVMSSTRRVKRAGTTTDSSSSRDLAHEGLRRPRIQPRPLPSNSFSPREDCLMTFFECLLPPTRCSKRRFTPSAFVFLEVPHCLEDGQVDRGLPLTWKGVGTSSRYPTARCQPRH